MRHHFLILLLILPVLGMTQTDCTPDRYLTAMFSGVTKTTVQYGKNVNINTTDSLDLFMDIYTPDGDNVVSRPAIILAHGGSFIAGNRSDLTTICIQYAQQGYVTASISYHLWPIISGFPDSLELIDVVIKAMGDMKGAIRYFKADQAGVNLWKVDSTRIIIGGYSAGAIAALHASHMDTVDTNLPAFIKTSIDANGGIEGQANKLNHGSDVLASVNLSGALYDRAFIDANDPPFISYHGNADATVPFRRDLANGIITLEGSALLHEQANLVGLSNRLDSVNGGGHTDIYVPNGSFGANLASFFVDANNFLGSKVCPELISPTQNLSLKTKVQVYPNPVSNILTLSLETVLPHFNLSIYSTLGELVFQNDYHNEVSIDVDVSKLARGIYTLYINTSESGSKGQLIYVDHH